MTLAEYFFTSPPAVVRLQMVSIFHASFSQTWRFCRNSGKDIQVRHESDDDIIDYQYMPMTIKALGTTNSLDQSLEIVLGDLGDALSEEIENISRENGFLTKPRLAYREYRSDSFNTDDGVFEDPIYGPFNLEITTLTFNKTGCVFTAKPPAFNRARTGELYDVGRFPMLRGFT